MRTPEGRVKDAVRQFLDDAPGCWYYRPVPSGYGKPSLDFVGCSYGRAFMIETKSFFGSKLTKRQALTVEAAIIAGCKVFIVYSALIPEDVKKWFYG